MSAARSETLDLHLHMKKYRQNVYNRMFITGKADQSLFGLIKMSDLQRINSSRHSFLLIYTQIIGVVAG